MPNIVSFLKSLLTANRIAALVTILTALAAFISGILGVFPAAWQNVALAGVGILTHVATVLKFLEGSQNWDRVQGHIAATQLAYEAQPVQPANTEKTP